MWLRRRIGLDLPCWVWEFSFPLEDDGYSVMNFGQGMAWSNIHLEKIEKKRKLSEAERQKIKTIVGQKLEV